MPEELKAPPLPIQYAHVVDWFEDLDGVRQYSMAGPQAIAYSEIAAWSTLKEVEPNPDEIQLLRMMDIVHLNTIATHQAAELDKRK